ncbi:protein FAR1-RELATED SEQUENCE 11-like isoform X1 [Rhizophagus irregularis DAOM 181602=DAOM 197198]|nr:protein FAR1-RELATED SEQUENCE 11-like isoform X1 [Rhizophagus irregularis DAOM 181602=DAOM 197198]
MAVPQEKSIIEAIETLTSNSQQSELYVGQHFISWLSAIAYVSEWCNLQGFQSRLDRSDRNNNMPAGEYRKLAIVCQHSGKYKKPLAELSLNNNIKENHKTIAKVSKTIRLGCKAHINLSRPEKNNVNQYVFVTTIVNEHCHELNSQLINYTKETALTREMIEDIKFLTLQVRLTITQQRVYLEKKYPERKIQSDILRYEIQKYRPSAKELNRDALNLYEHLLKLKKDDIRWQIFVNFDETKVLRRLLWMSPNQVELWIQYHDVIINDVTCKTNRYDMALSLFVTIDNHNNSRLVCQALIDDETAEAHAWIFECTLLATGGKKQSNETISGGLVPLVFMTDADLAVDAACIKIYQNCYTMHCIFHISQNLHKKFSKLLGNKYSEFLSEFYNARNSLSQERFEQLFTILIEKYEQAAEYLRNLYKTKTYWALCFTSTIFTAAVQSTSRVEGMNAVLKREILNSNTSLLQLAEVIHRRHKEEEKQKEFAFWKTVIPCVVDLQTASFLFSAIEALIKKYLTTPLYNLQVQEINQSVYYKCEQFELNQIDMFEQISEVIDTGFLEDLPDERKACIKSIFYHVNQREIKEIWGISVQNTQKFKHFILLMNNSAHLCSCLATVTREIVCRHYFSLMMHTHTAMFHIQLIRPRWYKNRDLDGKHEPFVFAAKFQDTELLKQPEINQEIFYLTALIQNNVDKWEQISKSTLDEKLFFGKVMGMAKKVTLKAVEKKDERIFEIFQRYLDELNDFEDELNSEIDTDDEANENSLQLQNPIKKPRKG